MLLNNEWVKNGINEKSKTIWKPMKMNTQHKSCEAQEKAVLRGKFRAVQAYPREKNLK